MSDGPVSQAMILAGLAPGAAEWVQMGEPEEIAPYVLIGQRPRRKIDVLDLRLGAGAQLASGTVIYLGSTIGARLQTGHHVVIREQNVLGDDVSVWSDTKRVGSDHIYYVYVIETEDRDGLRAALAAQGIQADIHYPVPLHLQPACAEFACPRGSLPVTEHLAGRILSLPMFPELTEHEVDRVCDAIRGHVLAGAPAR